YDRLGITFDLTLGESFYQPMLEDVVEELKERGIATDSEGAVCVFVEGNEAPLIIRKRDGAFTYATTDLATIKYRREKLKAESILYVVDARQSEHFRLVFEIARRWGFGDIDFRHVRFGTVLGRDGKPFKTRSGDTVGLESLLDEAVARARAIVDENDDAKPDGPELDEATRAAVAEVVGIGGIKYADLKHNRESDYVFDWDKMLAKNGDSATYIQYAYARICGIFRKGRIDREELRRGAGPVRIERPVERALVVQILQFPEAVDAAAAECRPNFLAQYLFETANRFTAFYDECQILPERDAERRRGWLLLCDLTARALKLGLELLGIAVCERM
ncbi:MAG TPA: arginine--tRNA ligase, partial [Planctomycetaceae bacterium]|nr:arginine--tRNA ligase [Planctomycetaceae bacterium]